jgi:hypothetical protein
MGKNNIVIFHFVLLMVFCISFTSAQVSPPAGWGDFQVGLVNDNSNIINVRMKKALSEGVKLHYRYAYVNNGVDPNTNALSWLFNQWGTDYSRNSSEMGVRPAYVIYMLQEEGGAAALKNNIQNAAFMRNYFTSIRIVAEKCNGYKAMFVIEPDTWGYFLQNALEQGTQSDPRLIPATVNNLGAGYEYLAGLPNTLSGVAQGVIRTIRRYAPDAYCGLLMSFWAVNANGVTGPPVADGGKGMVYWNQSDVDYSAKRNADFANQLLSATERGDFIGAEKNGWSAGNWLVKQNRNDYYWNDTQNAKWISWSKTLRQNVNLPLLGWQISIGHMGLPNTVNRYEDTFMPYFFSHVPEFIDAGFIGFLVGKGLADCTDFTNLNGNELEANGSAGDNGWFFEKLKTFDASRPYLGGGTPPAVAITAPANGATFATGSTVNISANAFGGTNCSVTKVEFFRGTVKLGEDISSPYSFSWTNVQAGSYALTAKLSNSCGGSVTSSAVNISVGNVAPTATITAPANNASFTAQASITIQASANDSDGTISKVEFFQGSTKLGEDTSSPYSLVWGGIAAGSYSLTVKATDNGGASTTSAPINITVNPDGGGSCSGVPQYVSGTNYADGAQVKNVNKKFSCKVSGWCSIGGAYEPGVGWAWSNAWTLLGDCSTGNNLPSVAITAPGNGATFTAPASITIGVAASDSDGTISKVEFFQGSTKLGEDLSSPYTFTWSNVVAGNYSLTAKATDNSGGITTSSAVNITCGNNSKPTASITAPANNATFTAPASITINANASDSDGTINKVEFFQGSTKLGEDTSSPYSLNWTNVSAGSYSLTVKATDNLNASVTSSVVNVTVNPSGSKPTTSITAPSNNTTYLSPANITISATASDADGTIVKVEFFNGSNKLGEDNTAPYSYNWQNVVQGTYSLTTRATDNAGATGTSAVVNVMVTGGGDNCSGLPQYAENGGYSAGSKVKNGNNYYECKPHPYSGWCNGAAWAYAPGTGSYWADAWILKGTCTGGGGSISMVNDIQEIEFHDDALQVYPNPGTKEKDQWLTLSFKTDPGHLEVFFRSINGAETVFVQHKEINKRSFIVNTSSLPQGLYILRINTKHRSWVKKLLIN